MATNIDLQVLHPSLRKKVTMLLRMLEQQNIPIALREGFRSPERQQALYNEGNGEAVWHSHFQYGVACDFGLFIDGQWSDQNNEESKAYWKSFHEIARRVGLERSRTHISELRLPDLKDEMAITGKYPAGGDEAWVNNLRSAILSWPHEPKPALPSLGLDSISFDIPNQEQPEKSTQ